MSDNQSNDQVEEMPIKAIRRKDISKVDTKRRQKTKKPQAKELEISNKLREMIESKLESTVPVYLRQQPTQTKTSLINLQSTESRVSHGIQYVYEPVRKQRTRTNFLDKIRMKADSRRKHYSQLSTFKR